VGRTSWSAADPPVGLLTRDVGVPRGPGGPPHLALIRDGRRSSAKTVPENEDPNGSRRV